MPAFEYVDAPTQDEDREGWLAARRNGVGSSDAAAVCGISPWGTPLSVFADKAWGVEPERAPHLDVGAFMEGSVARLYEKANPGAFLHPVRMCRSVERPWQLANVDRTRHDLRDVEIKLAYSSQGWGAVGTDEVPPHYFLQCQHQLDVRGAEVMDLAALLGGLDYRQYEIRLDAQIVLRLREVEAEFWERVKEVRAPEPDFAHEATAELVKRLCAPTVTGGMKLPAECAEMAEQFKALGEQVSALEKQRKSLRAQIEHRMGQSAVASLPGGLIVRRKLVTRKAHAVKESTYIDFRITRGDSDE